MKFPLVTRRRLEKVEHQARRQAILMHQEQEQRWQTGRPIPAGWCLIPEDAVEDYQKNGTFTRPVDLIWSWQGGKHRNQPLGPELDWMQGRLAEIAKEQRLTNHDLNS